MTFLHSLVLHWGGPQHWNGELFLSQLGVQQTIKSAIEHIKTRSYSNHKHVYMVNCMFIHNENSLTLSSRDSHAFSFHCLPYLIYPPAPSPSFLPSFLLSSLPHPFPPNVTPLLPSPSSSFPPLSSFFLTFWWAAWSEQPSTHSSLDSRWCRRWCQAGLAPPAERQTSGLQGRHYTEL